MATNTDMRGSFRSRKGGLWGWRDVVIPDEQSVDDHNGCEQEELEIEDPGLPNVEEFSFDGVLKAVDPEGVSFLVVLSIRVLLIPHLYS